MNAEKNYYKRYKETLNQKYVYGCSTTMKLNIDVKKQ